MTTCAYIHLQETISLADLHHTLIEYQQKLARTGKQLSWPYEEAAFPYKIQMYHQYSDEWLLLKSTSPPRYRTLMIGVQEEPSGTSTIHVLLPSTASFGDKGKANELCRYLATLHQAKLTLFNGRVQSFQD
ncbi:DUF1885 family protein [Mechercharimyces sp. CAU 1602]|nr:DUF1885 family protein [Mechercharimyces sp. CAU 1602]